MTTPDHSDVWIWLFGGVLAIAVGLTVWPLAFLAVPGGLVLIAVGAGSMAQAELGIGIFRPTGITARRPAPR
jgi:hypothetical protein